MTESGIRKLQERGVLEGRKGRDGVYRFRPIDVAALAKERGLRFDAATPGAIASRVFKMFKEGSDLQTVVIVMELEPKVVRELWDEYTTPAGKRPPITPTTSPTRGLELLAAREAREQEEHEARMRALDDAEDARRRREDEQNERRRARERGDDG